MVEWRQQFDDLRQRRPGLAARVCRRLLRDLQKKKLVDLDALDELAAALKAGQRKTHDPNRPKPRMTNGSKEELYDSPRTPTHHSTSSDTRSTSTSTMRREKQ